MPQPNADRYVAEIEASTAGLAEILAEHDQGLPIPPARNGHCVSLSRTLAGRTGGRPRSRVRGLTRSFRSGRYRTASCRMTAPSSARG